MVVNGEHKTLIEFCFTVGSLYWLNMKQGVDTLINENSAICEVIHIIIIIHNLLEIVTNINIVVLNIMYNSHIQDNVMLYFKYV